jgi:hypothetical protein
MRISKLEDNKIYIEIPLTSQSGKARVKIRNSFYEYGLPTATKQNPYLVKEIYNKIKEQMNLYSN